MKKLTLPQIKTWISSYGRCLSTNYVNSRSKLTWKCRSCRHVWQATWNNIKQGHWCPACAQQDKPSLFKLQKLAQQFKGFLLSTQYHNSTTPLQWQCHAGHKFKKSYRSVKQGQWCSKCGGVFWREEICRLVLEKIFRKPFPKSKPLWLFNEQGYQLELDGYCAELNLAFEHNGLQHYQLSRFTKNTKTLKKIIQNDEVKFQRCQQQGVKLLVIPQLFEMTKIKDFKQLLLTELQSNFPDIENKIEKINFNKIIKQISSWKNRIKTHRKYSLKFFKELARAKNGKCLSTVYRSTAQQLKLKCLHHRHVWTARASHVLAGSWCPLCQRDKRRITIKQIHQLAIDKGILCLSTKIKGSQDRLTWQCRCGNRFVRAVSYVKNGSVRCQKCKKNKMSKIV